MVHGVDKDCWRVGRRKSLEGTQRSGDLDDDIHVAQHGREHQQRCMGVGTRRGSHREWSTATGGGGGGGDDGRRASARRCSAIAPSERSLW
jgi:hypothetical protein